MKTVVPDTTKDPEDLSSGDASTEVSVPKRRRTFGRIGLLIAGIVGVVMGAIVGRLFPPFVLDHGFWRDFLTSAGFGGLMAVLAAVIAYGAARYAATSARTQAERDRLQRHASERKEQWWARAEWALNQVVKGNADIGYKMLDALAESEWADEHEGDVIAAATEDALLSIEVVDTLTESESTAQKATAPGSVIRSAWNLVWRGQRPSTAEAHERDNNERGGARDD